MNESAVSRPSAEQIREELARILGSPLFSNARRLSQFLEFVVVRAVNGQAAEIKELLIGVEVYGRDPSYDPKADSIVRAEASRLRSKLREYYETLGREDPVRIDLPKGSYSPAFQLLVEEPPPAPAPPPPAEPAPAPAAAQSKFPLRWVAAAGVLLVVIALAWWLPRGLHRSHLIAVIALANLSPDHSADRLGDTLTDEIVRALVGANEWKVVGRAPNLDLSGPNQMLAPLRQNMGAEVVFSGSYRVEQASVRITLQLTNVADGYLLWTRTYQQPMSWFAESGREVAREAVAAFTRKYIGRATPPEVYAQAREAWSAYSQQELVQSLKLFQEAIDAAPNYAPAWAGLADANMRLSTMPVQPTKTRLAEARTAALKALELDESNAEAHAVLGKIYLYEDSNPTAAVTQLQRAVALDPTRLSPNVRYSEALTVVGDMQRAEEVIEAARARLPPMPDLVFQQGSVLFLARKWERLEEIGRELIALEPGQARGHWLLGLSFEQRGRIREAIAEFQAGLRQGAKDDLRTLCALAHAYGLAGEQSRALEFMNRFFEFGPRNSRYSLPCCAALTYISLKETDKALDFLEMARTTKDAAFLFVPYDARYDPLRGEVRFKNLVASLKAAPNP